MSIMVVFLCRQVDCKSNFCSSTKVGRVKEGWKQSLSDIVPVQVKNKYPSNKKIEDEAEKVRRMLFLRGSERIFHWPKIEAKPEKS